MKRPYDSWADVYDLVYEEEFGAFYEQLTQLTLSEIGKVVSPPSSIVDFGAGTGRLSLPLAKSGYRVTAVEPSAPMLKRLRRAANDLDIVCVEASMQEFRSDHAFILRCAFLWSSSICSMKIHCFKPSRAHETVSGQAVGFY